MIRVKITEGTFRDDLVIAGHGDTECFMKTEGKHPGEVFQAMIEMGCEWEVDFSEATPEEEHTWLLAEIVAYTVRAERRGQTVFLDGELLNTDEVMPALLDFMTKYHEVPEVIDDNSCSLILGKYEG